MPDRRTVVSRNAARPCRDSGVARPKQSRHPGRCHAYGRAWPQIQKMCCAPVVGEGCNPMLRRGRCAGLLCEAVPTTSSYSESIEEQKGKGRRSESASAGLSKTRATAAWRGLLVYLTSEPKLVIGCRLCAPHPITALESGWGLSGLVHSDGVDPFEIRVVGGDGGNLEIHHGLQGERII